MALKLDVLSPPVRALPARFSIHHRPLFLFVKVHHFMLLVLKRIVILLLIKVLHNRSIGEKSNVVVGHF